MLLHEFESYTKSPFHMKQAFSPYKTGLPPSKQYPVPSGLHRLTQYPP